MVSAATEHWVLGAHQDPREAGKAASFSPSHTGRDQNVRSTESSLTWGLFPSGAPALKASVVRKPDMTDRYRPCPTVDPRQWHLLRQRAGVLGFMDSSGSLRNKGHLCPVL